MSEKPSAIGQARVSRARWGHQSAHRGSRKLPAKADAHVDMLCGNHDEHGGDVRASQNGPAAVTSVTTLPGRRPEAPTAAIVSSAVRFCCKLEEFEKVSEGGLEPPSWWYIPESGIYHQSKVTRRRSRRSAIRDAS